MAIRDVTVELGGATHVLRSDLGAWAAIEDVGGEYITLIKSLNEGGPKMRAVLLLLWGYLDHEKPRPSLEDVGRWVTTANFGVVTEAILEAFRQGIPEDVPSGPRLADAGIGPSSASSPPGAKSRRKVSGG
jgi:hypothetical protein